MKAGWYERNGPAREVFQVGETEVPEPGPGEVRVRIAASGVNPSDVKSRRGRPPAWPRIIPHSDGAGVIEAVGSAVPRTRIGERVWTWNGQWKRPSGTAAEFISLPADQAVRLPERVDMAAGACLGIPALTALQAVRLQGDVAGRTLLVTGAGAAVGHYVTQMARLRGARVIGTTSAARAEHALSAGADHLIDYRSDDVAEKVKALTGGAGCDGVIDMDLSSTGPLLAKGVLKPHGSVVCYGSNVAGEIPIPFPAMLWNSHALRFMIVYELLPEDRHAAIAELTAMLELGVLKHSVGARFQLAEIATAHEAVEAGNVIGNVVLDVS